ncbi:MAG: hypothetical protein OEV42_10580 [Deltaproteobacteria bacterium]|nr:hypothetical protein [Deltaproteobacteria bacterium]
MKKGTWVFAALIIGVLGASPGYAKVSSDEARRVIDYYYTGKGGGAVFLKAALCKEVIKEGPEKNNCGTPVDESNFPMNEEITAWASFLVPQGDSDTIYVEFKNMGMVWKVRELKVKGSVRYRSWTAYKLDRPGKWTISFKQLDEGKQQSVVLQSFQVNVQ